MPQPSGTDPRPKARDARETASRPEPIGQPSHVPRYRPETQLPSHHQPVYSTSPSNARNPVFPRPDLQANYAPAPGVTRPPQRQYVQTTSVPSATQGMLTHNTVQYSNPQITSRVQPRAPPREGDPVDSLGSGISGIQLQNTHRTTQTNAVPGGANQQPSTDPNVPQRVPANAPANAPTDSTLRRYSVPAEATFFQNQRRLDDRYFVRPSSFYVVGRVFAVLWHEGFNSMTSQNTYVSDNNDNRVQISTGLFGEPIYSSIRRMVVVRQDRGYCVCLQINTYGNRGLSKFKNSSEDVEAHSRIYMVGTEPKWLEKETLTSSREDIAVVGVSPEQRLSVASRLCYGRVHTVEHTVKSLHVGQVTEASQAYLLGYFRERQARNVR